MSTKRDNALYYFFFSFFFCVYDAVLLEHVIRGLPPLPLAYRETIARNTWATSKPTNHPIKKGIASKEVRQN